MHSVQAGIFVFGKAHMRSTASLRRCPSFALETVPTFTQWPVVVLSRKIAQRFFFLRLPSPDSRGCDVTGLVPAAFQHFRSCETQATCDGCFASRSACSDISLHSGMSLESASAPVFLPRWLSNIDTCQSEIYCSRLSGRERKLCCSIAPGFPEASCAVL